MSHTLEIILYVAGAIITISSAAGIITKSLKGRISKIATEVSKEIDNKTLEEVKKDMKEISDQLNKLNQNTSQYHKNTDKMLASLARDRINQAHAFYIEHGSIDDHSMFTLEELFKSYTKMGGNGQVHTQMETLRDLYKESCKKGII